MENIEEIEAAILGNAEYLSSEKMEVIGAIISGAKERILSVMFGTEGQEDE